MLADDLVQRSVITVEAWGSIDGVWLNHGHPMKAKRIMPGYSGAAGHWITGAELKTDENGHFSSAAVPPGTISINWLAPPPSFTGGSLYLELAKETVGPGQTAAVHIVTDGRAVTGRLVSGANVEEISSLAGWVVTLNPDIPGPPKQPKEVDTPEAMMKWFDDWKGTKDGAEYVAAQRKTRQACVGEGGSLEMEAVVPGKYLLRGYVFGPTGLAANVETVKIEVPDGENAYDIGAIHYQPKKNLKVGDEAPPFQVGTLDGGSVSLSDFRGKYVLLDFWAVWCGACVAEMANLKEVYDAFHGDPRFVMLSLSLDEDIAVPKKFAQQRGTSVWPQAFLGPWGKDKVHQGYDVYGIPQILLIGPDGRIIATGLRGGSIKTSIGKALGQPAAN
jgi:thiol-disulfide isomerase/thioredoxin